MVQVQSSNNGELVQHTPEEDQKVQRWKLENEKLL